MSKKTITVLKFEELLQTQDFSNHHKILVAVGGEDMDASDGYHTFTELYDHRISLYIALCKWIILYKGATDRATAETTSLVWRSKRHSDGEVCFGTGTQFVLGIGTEKGEQVTYHIPIERWDETDFAHTLEIAPEWDGHSSDDVIERLKKL